MERTDRSIADLLAGYRDDARTDMVALDSLIAQVMDGLPKAVYSGVFWGGTNQDIIGYGTYTSIRPNGVEVDWFVVGLALQKNYISLYVSAVEDGQYLSKRRGADLGTVKVGSSSVSFKGLDAIDMDKLREFLKTARRLAIEAGTEFG